LGGGEDGGDAVVVVFVGVGGGAVKLKIEFNAGEAIDW
jgi:hypothetical protein